MNGEHSNAPTPLTTERNNVPKFEHDCSKCTFLGHLNGHDLYHCMQGGAMPTVIARWGSDGSEYKSGLTGADIDPELGWARQFARERGLVV